MIGPYDVREPPRWAGAARGHTDSRRSRSLRAFRTRGVSRFIVAGLSGRAEAAGSLVHRPFVLVVATNAAGKTRRLHQLLVELASLAARAGGRPHDGGSPWQTDLVAQVVGGLVAGLPGRAVHAGVVVGVEGGGD